MTTRNYISSFIIFSFTFVLFSCKVSSKLSFEVTYLDTTIKATKISVS
jgi:hypothetical protein